MLHIKGITLATDPKPVYAGPITTDENNVWDTFTVNLTDLYKSEKRRGKTKVTLGLNRTVVILFIYFTQGSINASTLTEGGSNLQQWALIKTKLASCLMLFNSE
jgi:hypothetical protein